jgi:hypothetical protein
MRPLAERSWPIFATAFTLVILLVSAAIGLAVWELPADNLPVEVRQPLIQFLLVVALGAVVTFLVDYLRTRAEQRAGDRKYRTDTIRSLLERLDSIYRRVKHTRQRLGIKPGHRPDNEDEMWRLREEQEDLEQLGKDIEVHETMFEGLDSARSRVEAMDDYLGKCWVEYRTKSRGEVHGSQTFGPRLSMFVESPKSGNSDFPQFSDGYHKARKILIQLLIPAPTAGSSRRRSASPRRPNRRPPASAPTSEPPATSRKPPAVTRRSGSPGVPSAPPPT